MSSKLIKVPPLHHSAADSGAGPQRWLAVLWKLPERAVEVVPF